jgi:tetratricopeptide (TPR) repeat protein
MGFQGNIAEAVASYEKAIVLDANFVLALFNLGQAHDRLGNVSLS